MDRFHRWDITFSDRERATLRYDAHPPYLEPAPLATPADSTARGQSMAGMRQEIAEGADERWTSAAASRFSHDWAGLRYLWAMSVHGGTALHPSLPCDCLLTD